MNIAIVCYPTFGGSGVVATELGIALSKMGHNIHFVTYNQPVRLDRINTPNLFFHEVNVPDYPLFKYQPYELALSSRLVDVVKAHSIDVLHVHYAIPHAYAAYMAKKMLLDEDISIPIVTTLHGTDITLVGSHPFYRPAVTFSINHSDCVTAVSESLKQDTLRLFDIKTEIKVIPNFIDTKKFENKEKPCERSLLAPTDDKIITHISNFRPLKRINDVIDVFEQISTNVSSKLLMVGEGPEKSKAMAYVKSKGLNEKVVFLGNSNEIDKILCYSDLFLLPSEMESFGLVALEAMANGVPVISSNAGGLSEVNKHGFSGFLSDVGDVNSMAKNALELLLDEEKLNKFKKQAKKQAQLFNIDKVVTEYEDIYKRALTK
ncbi:N-acetyl-alpha-D-glucosaminyl L-malate synthase BshA [Flavobacteriaceae bacterium]|nr:N-acetyl-alpha-D-glucosaminyl L-malate synthase BshA [Flavobacteriaceae bacterium]MBT4313854.1 N-acetyl-alpha-D-glucosaminyl L-malate synthase BshA [Flavobacteriaceae bacterium]MBT5090814.1 N-acetyl-alpha-D-glucosaminyl L-malate synthase BshA [Flavobacteriaceae bacterium]MBT5284244.1 N-acetyl-alpha-D-glucosaminyl L-malate synthase BshA [Flavobacteriaceae bacterium]MBT5446226.1 N-acetyl-alpha-D-glucosaminyl L-malate synthase BshA [Flavobacteriaceae bacterium]